MIGFEMRLPGGHEGFLELRKEWVGFGWSGDRDDREIYLGLVQATVSRSRGHAEKVGRKRAIAAAFLLGLAIPVHYGMATERLTDWVAKLNPSNELVLEKRWQSN
ncbi:hypothetical protein [Neorhizobium galegae]|uniref:Uncharacterized protein n=1 Tax=Neorhizobium galegae bv. orientalis str. HAMBI 540 TaxID=1028800 RepID=A0A068SMS5_NEOGA|nr:hypothetical protein [Neorhizobium galegae]CDN47587.1 Hypothetical protein RG540_CH14070 [Neorhizobium galegae bv. orientalis str. HAMBI 540]